MSDITVFSVRIGFLRACYDMKLYNNASRIFGMNNFPSNRIQNRRGVAELLAEGLPHSSSLVCPSKWMLEKPVEVNVNLGTLD